MNDTDIAEAIARNSGRRLIDSSDCHKGSTPFLPLFLAVMSEQENRVAKKNDSLYHCG